MAGLENPNQPEPHLPAPDTLLIRAEHQETTGSSGPTGTTTTSTTSKPTSTVSTKKSEPAAPLKKAASDDDTDKPPLWAKVAIGVSAVAIVVLGITLGKKKADNESDYDTGDVSAKAKDAARKAKQAGKNAASDVKSNLSGWTHKAEDKDAELARKNQHRADTIADKIHDAGSAVKSTVVHGAEKTKDAVQDAAHNAKDSGKHLKEHWQGAADDVHHEEKKGFRKWFG